MCRARVWPRIGAVRPLVMAGSFVWRIKRRPVLNTWAAEEATLSLAEDQIAPERSPWSHTAPIKDVVSGYAVRDWCPGGLS